MSYLMSGSSLKLEIFLIFIQRNLPFSSNGEGFKNKVFQDDLSYQTLVTNVDDGLVFIVVSGSLYPEREVNNIAVDVNNASLASLVVVSCLIK